MVLGVDIFSCNEFATDALRVIYMVSVSPCVMTKGGGEHLIIVLSACTASVSYKINQKKCRLISDLNEDNSSVVFANVGVWAYLHMLEL